MLVYAGVVCAAAGGGRLHGAQAASFVDGLHRAVAVSGVSLLAAALLAGALIPSGLLSRAGAALAASAQLSRLRLLVIHSSICRHQS